MIARISGIVMLVNTLLPVLIIVGLISIGVSLSTPLSNIGHAVDGMTHEANVMQKPYDKAMKVTKKKIRDSKKRIAKAKKAHDQLSKVIKKGFDAININIKFPKLPKIAGIKLPQLPDINIKIGDVISKPFKAITNALGYFFTIFSNVGDIAEEWAKIMDSESMERMAGHASDAKAATQDLAKRIHTIFTVILWICVVLIPWLLLSYSLWSYSRIKRALALLCGERRKQAVYAYPEAHHYPPIPSHLAAA